MLLISLCAVILWKIFDFLFHFSIFGFTLSSYVYTFSYLFAAFMPRLSVRRIFFLSSVILAISIICICYLDIYLARSCHIKSNLCATLFTYLVVVCAFFNVMRCSSRARWLRINELRFCEGFSISFAWSWSSLAAVNSLYLTNCDAWHKEIELKLVYNSKYKHPMTLHLIYLFYARAWLLFGMN